MSFRDHDYSSNSDLFNVPTIMSLHSYHDCVLAYLIHKEIIKCETLNSKLSSVDTNYVFRKIRQVFDSVSRTNYSYFSTVDRISRTWNRLPLSLRNISSLCAFKVALRNHIIAYH